MTGQEEHADPDEKDRPQTFAHRLDRLFRAHGSPSLREVAEAIRRRAGGGGATRSATSLWLLRPGRRRNPTLDHLALLADHCGVPPASFFDDALTEQDRVGPELLAALRAPDVRALALRSAGLSSLGRRALATLAEQLAQIEGQTVKAGGFDGASTPRSSDGAT